MRYWTGILTHPNTAQDLGIYSTRKHKILNWTTVWVTAAYIPYKVRIRKQSKKILNCLPCNVIWGAKILYFLLFLNQPPKPARNKLYFLLLVSLLLCFLGQEAVCLPVFLQMIPRKMESHQWAPAFYRKRTSMYLSLLKQPKKLMCWDVHFLKINAFERQ